MLGQILHDTVYLKTVVKIIFILKSKTRSITLHGKVVKPRRGLIARPPPENEESICVGGGVSKAESPISVPETMATDSFVAEFPEVGVRATLEVLRPSEVPSQMRESAPKQKQMKY